jgi:hypothetical protein
MQASKDASDGRRDRSGKSTTPEVVGAEILAVTDELEHKDPL